MSGLKLKLSVSWLCDGLIENTIRVGGVYDLEDLKAALRQLVDNLDDITKEEDWPKEN